MITPPKPPESPKMEALRAPERIWIGPKDAHKGFGSFIATRFSPSEILKTEIIEYIRADVARAELAALREALGKVEGDSKREYYSAYPYDSSQVMFGFAQGHEGFHFHDEFCKTMNRKCLKITAKEIDRLNRLPITQPTAAPAKKEGTT